MRRFVLTFSILLLAAGAVSFAPRAHAAVGDQCTGGFENSLGDCVADGSTCNFSNTGNDGVYRNGVCESNGTQNGSQGARVGAPGGNVPAAHSLGEDADSLFATVMTWIMSLFAWLVGLAAMELDYAMYYTVVNMGNYIHNLTAIGIVWRILRDLGNILLIFGFIAAGITTILNVDWYGVGKKMLPMLLIAAVLLNFSLFFAEAVIDVGNLFATQIFTQINGGVPVSPAELDKIVLTGNGSTPLGNEGISNAIMGQLGFQTIYNSVRDNPALLRGDASWIVSFMAIILFLVTAFVLFSLAFILVARFVMLVFVIITSPLGFAGLAFPQLKGIAGKWWHMLISQTLTAPVLLLLLYIALRVILDAQFLLAGSGQAWTGFWPDANGRTDLPGFAGIVLSFLVAMGLLLAVTIAAKSLGAFSAGWATKTAGRMSFGAAGLLGRGTVGWGSQRAAGWLRSTRFARVPVLGRAVVGTLDRGAKASFDLRATGALKSAAHGVDMGKAAGEGGFRKWEEEKIKEREKYAKDLKQSTGVRIFGKQITSNEVEQQKIEEGRVKALEVAHADMLKQHQKEREAQKKDQAAAIAPYERKFVEAAEKLQSLQSKRNRNEAVSDVEYQKAESDAKAARSDLQTQRSKQDAMIRKMKETQKRAEAAQEKRIKETKELVVELKNAGQEGYARGLEGPWLIGGTFLNPKRNEEGAKKIREAFKKSKGEKDLERIKKFIEESDKPEKGGKEGKEEKAEGEEKH